MLDILLGIGGSDTKAHFPCCQGAPSLVEESDNHTVTAWEDKVYYSHVEWVLWEPRQSRRNHLAGKEESEGSIVVKP